MMRFTIYLLLVSIFFACSSTSEKKVPKAYHNITAKYNAYFLAREKMKMIEKQLFDQRKDNYNRVLDVIPPLDTNSLGGLKDSLKYVIDKAALIPSRHENSRWVDDSYVVIGKSRFYQQDFENAVQTFKYVNTKADAPEAKHRALIELFRTYIEQDDDKSAYTVLNYLRKQQMEDNEKWNFYLLRGHYFRLKSDYIETAKSLGSAVKLMPRGERRGRSHFILGQIYQKLERNELAYKNYKSVLKNNPSYELAFYTRLYLAQVTNLGESKDIKKIRRYFKKLLRDEKNDEYQDKIYYEMAVFEERQEHIKGEKGAIDYLNRSVGISQNPIQKAYSFLRLGEIHYAKLQKYELAKSYYDSVMASLPKNVEDYKKINRRHKTLTEFVEQLNIYRTEDSLQKVAKLKEPARGQYITKMLTIEETRKQDIKDSIDEARAKLKKIKANSGSSLNSSVGNNTARTWYFDNITAITKGQGEFRKTWGDRPLEDNWRRRNKEPEPVDSIYLKSEGVDPQAAKIIRQQLIQKRVDERKNALYEALPETDADFKASDKKIEDALFELGKIYAQKLEEPQNSVEYFEKLLSRFPNTRHEAEALYSLYLSYKNDLKNNAKAESYKNKLKSKYPNSKFAKLVDDPNYLLKAAANEKKVEAAYQKAFRAYKLRSYSQALAEIKTTKQKYPVNLMQDKLDLLEILIQNKIDPSEKDDLKTKLDAFLKKYPSSTLKEYVEKLMKKL